MKLSSLVLLLNLNVATPPTFKLSMTISLVLLIFQSEPLVIVRFNASELVPVQFALFKTTFAFAPSLLPFQVEPLRVISASVPLLSPFQVLSSMFRLVLLPLLSPVHLDAFVIVIFAPSPMLLPVQSVAPRLISAPSLASIAPLIVPSAMVRLPPTALIAVSLVITAFSLILTLPPLTIAIPSSAVIFTLPLIFTSAASALTPVLPVRMDFSAFKVTSLPFALIAVSSAVSFNVPSAFMIMSFSLALIVSCAFNSVASLVKL